MILRSGLGLSVLMSLAAGVVPSPGAGVVVESVGRLGAGERAGLKPGDVVDSWERPGLAGGAGRRGGVRSPLDLVLVELEEAPTGLVTLLGRRAGATLAVPIAQDEWRLVVRPALGAESLARYEDGRRLRDAGEAAQAADAWRALAADLGASGAQADACWLLLQTAETLARAKARPEARETYGLARDAARKAGSAGFEAVVWQAEGDALRGPITDYPEAEKAYREALVLREREAPNGLAVAASLVRLGRLAAVRRDDIGTEAPFLRALSIREAAVPESLATAEVVNFLAGVAYIRGDLQTAEFLWKKALAVQEKLAPESRDTSGSLGNLGLVAQMRGDPARAEDFHRRALALIEKIAPQSREAAYGVEHLGNVALQRGDHALAEARYKRASEMFQQLVPGGREVAGVLYNLGGLAFSRGDWAAAEAYHREALAARERLSPDSLDVAASLEELGHVLSKRGDLQAGEELLNRALAIQQRLASGTLIEAETLYKLGELALAREDPAAALRWHGQGLGIRSRLAPGTSDEAKSFRGIGSVHRKAGRLPEAAAAWSRALEALDAQRGKLGALDRGGSAFAAEYSAYYRDLAELLVEQGRAAEALHVLERSRARGLLAMLAERDLTFAGDLPPDLAREQRQADAEYDRTEARMARLAPGKDEAEIRGLIDHRQELRDRRAQIARRVRALSPRLAALRDPEPLSLLRVQESLDPGTVLLAYSVGVEKTLLFVVQPRTKRPGSRDEGLSVFTLPIGEQALAARVRAFVGFIERGRDSGALEPALLTQGAALFELLLAPARGLLEPSRRLLVSPDGPLHVLPFAALVRAQQPLEYLAEWKPLHTVVSATLYAELKKSRRARRPAKELSLVAFGDPSYPPEADVVKARGLKPLPWTREEVRRITALYPAGSALAYLGSEATEERAKALGRGLRYLHFASHAVLDNRFPLDSALVLTIPQASREGQQNGLLQAWEIFESLRLDADLVTLSACQTALGAERGGDGLVGLARAFQFAGARSVLASLWAISDRSAAELMTRFYGFLKQGMAKDEALQASQRALIHGAVPASGDLDPRHPFYWAAFEVIGDWR